MLQTLGFSLGTAFASGLNLYATVAMLGLLERFKIIHLPPPLEILAHPAVLSLALILLVIEFVADKIPYVDSIWHAVHTVIRPLAAALLVYGAYANVPEIWRVAAGLLGGSVALTSHGTKASAHAAANASPEPFSNSILSVSEDALAVFLTWLAVRHPLITIVVVAALIALCIFAIVKLFGFLARIIRRIFGKRVEASTPIPAVHDR
ncbi:MAG TPA: DUF4126 domain-containing protein [Acidobacteriota bacterium]|nr:DUF4126 domain-containing protein [Acidobacteriota bacterium]